MDTPIKNKKIHDQMENLASKRQQVKFQEKLLKEKEKKLLIKRKISIGSLVHKAGIETLDDSVLMGAFLEIKERSKDLEFQKKWEKRGEEFLLSSETSNNNPLIISFSKDPSPEMKNTLKSLLFRWNSFRREWYGYGLLEDLKSIVLKEHGTVEIAPD